MTMTRPAIIRLTVAVPLALAVLFSVPAQRSAAGKSIARAGSRSSLGAAASPHQMSNGKIAFSNRSDLYAINPDGTGQKQLTRFCPSGAAYCAIKEYAWSPNGKRLAFVKGDPIPGSRIVTLSLFVVNADGSGEKRLARSGQVTGYNWGYSSGISWSPDGSKIVFSDLLSLYVVKVNGGGLRRFTDCTQKSCRDDSPAWSPDGSRIAFARGENSSIILHVVNADGSGLKALTHPLMSGLRHPTWSPNGRSIAFDGDDGVYTMHADGSHLNLLVSGPPGSEPGHPSWSPDGTRILYASTAEDSGLEVWVMNANGTGRRRLYHSVCCHGAPGSPIWSPDGKYIAFNRQARSHLQVPSNGIFLMDADGHHVHRLTRAPTLIAWQPIP